MRKCYCRTKTGTICWAYKKDSDENFIPDILFKVGDNYEKLHNISTEEFDRWCTSFDL